MKRFTMLVAAAFAVAAAPLASAAVVNVDLGMPGDRTHSGSDGALSSGGIRWNAVVYNLSATGLLDETGVPTQVGVAYPAGTFTAPFLDLASMNDLQDTGLSGGGFEIRNLDPAARYTLVVYSTMNTRFDLIHAGGNAGGTCSSGSPTYFLPGTMGRDYCRFEELVPFEVSPGVFGLRLSGLTGAVTGFQLLGSAPDPGPVDSSPPSCTSSLPGSTPATLEVTIRDEESGLAGIDVADSENATVDIEAFDPGTVLPVGIVVHAVDPALPARVSLGSNDVAGNTSVCTFELEAESVPEPGCGTPEGCCELTLGFLRTAREDGEIRGRGPGNSAPSRAEVVERMLAQACDLVRAGDRDGACAKLASALKRADGLPDPPDFVEGAKVAELADRIRQMRADLGCPSEDPSRSRFRTAAGKPEVAPATWGLLKSLYESNE